MKILIIANKFPYPAKDGGSIATLNLAQGLQKLGHHITLLAINTSKHYFEIENLPDNLKQKIDFKDCFVNTDIKFFKLLQNLLFSSIPYNAERFINSDFEKEIVDILQNNRFDIIQLEGLYILPYIETIRKHSSANIAYRSHNIEFEIWERVLANERNLLKKIYTKILVRRLRKFEKKLINSYDSVLPITQRDLNALNQYGNTKESIVVPTGVDISNYIQEKKYIYPSLFFIGALDWIPNQEGLLWFLENCWSKINEEDKNLTLKIAGRNAPDDFINRIKKFNIEYIGEVENAIAFMNENAIMIAPLLSGSGMRIKIVEGMALGKVIITTNIGAEGIDVEHNKNILLANSSEEVIQLILEVTKNKTLFDEISIHARSFISKHYDNFVIAEKVSDFYKRQLNAIN
jgi:glycosyltransferase involved in cell wall biosynthesis